MKRYRLISGDYAPLRKNRVYSSNLKPWESDMSVEVMAMLYPEDWKEVAQASKFNIINRLAVAPLVLIILLLFAFFHGIKAFCNFIAYGGEFITYDKTDRETIHEIYKKLKSNSRKQDEKNHN